MMSQITNMLFIFDLLVTLFLCALGVIIKEMYTKLKKPEYIISTIKIIISIIMSTALSFSFIDKITQTNPKLYFIVCIVTGGITFELMNILLSVKCWVKIIEKFTGMKIYDIIEDNNSKPKEEESKDE